jgi:DNA-binding MarR family transcriptional regulator
MENAEIARNLMSSFQQFRLLFKGQGNFAGLKHSEMGLLFHIRGGCSAEPEGMKVSELSSKMHVTSPSITQLVTSMEEQGLVVRKMDREDRRSVKVSLTDKGNEITIKAEQEIMAMLTGLVDYMGHEKSLALIEIFNDVFAYLSTRNI